MYGLKPKVLTSRYLIDSYIFDSFVNLPTLCVHVHKNLEADSCKRLLLTSTVVMHLFNCRHTSGSTCQWRWWWWLYFLCCTSAAGLQDKFEESCIEFHGLGPACGLNLLNRRNKFTVR